MSELPSIAGPITTSGLLAATASVLLVFVSVGVIYLSAVEWRDRRRRLAAEKGSSSGGSGAQGSSPRREQRSPAAFGRRS